MAGLAPLWDKFGNPSGQVRQRNCPGLLSYSQNSVVGIVKGQDNVTATYELHVSELVLRNTY